MTDDNQKGSNHNGAALIGQLSTTILYAMTLLFAAGALLKNAYTYVPDWYRYCSEALVLLVVWYLKSGRHTLLSAGVSLFTIAAPASILSLFIAPGANGGSLSFMMSPSAIVMGPPSVGGGVMSYWLVNCICIVFAIGIVVPPIFLPKPGSRLIAADASAEGARNLTTT